MCNIRVVKSSPCWRKVFRLRQISQANNMQALRGRRVGGRARATAGARRAGDASSMVARSFSAQPISGMEIGHRRHLKGGVGDWEGTRRVESQQVASQCNRRAPIFTSDAYKVYKYMAKTHREHRKLFKYLSHFEHGHYDVLKREKEHFEDELEDMPHKHNEPLVEMPHHKDFGFRVFE